MVNPKKLTLLHQQAMRFAHQADAALDVEARSALLHKAYEAERDAADSLFESIREEPSRSILYRSAAVLALDCKEIREAERLASCGLAGNPPSDIAAELRAVLDRTHFQRYLESIQEELTDDEFEMNLVGPATILGFASAHLLFPRYRAAQALFYRTAERLNGLPFTERPRRETIEDFSFLYSPPKEASFAITVRVARNRSLPGTSYAERVIGEIVECMALFDKSQDQELDARIPAEYRDNFNALAGQLAPDGKDVTIVSLTTGPKERQRQVSVTRTANTAPEPSVALSDMLQVLESGRVTVRGTLAWADSLKKKKTRYIKIETAEGRVYRVAVPGEIMHDIVTPYYESEVEAVLDLERRGRGRYRYVSIRPI